MNIRTPRSQAAVIARAAVAGKATELYNQFMELEATHAPNVHKLADIAERHEQYIVGIYTQRQADEMAEILADYGITA
jgi:hypothetical protein